MNELARRQARALLVRFIDGPAYNRVDDLRACMGVMVLASRSRVLGVSCGDSALV
jgi:hypothetical protein